mmetsp:Transcript_92445/g.234991  ORF Transcript_92445/g.234991 Transcript_92445/m.234991 type:complete len:240 (+) Transcript_92445:801-1520(+)
MTSFTVKTSVVHCSMMPLDAKYAESSPALAPALLWPKAMPPVTSLGSAWLNIEVATQENIAKPDVKYPHHEHQPAMEKTTCPKMVPMTAPRSRPKFLGPELPMALRNISAAAAAVPASYVSIVFECPQKPATNAKSMIAKLRTTKLRWFLSANTVRSKMLVGTSAAGSGRVLRPAMNSSARSAVMRPKAQTWKTIWCSSSSSSVTPSMPLLAFNSLKLAVSLATASRVRFAVSRSGTSS